MSTKSALALFDAAHALIKNEAHWTKGVFARDREKYVAFPEGLAACQWCSIGAVMAAEFWQSADGHARTRVRDALQAAVTKIDNQLCVFEFNDANSHADVMRMWESARSILMTEPV